MVKKLVHMSKRRGRVIVRHQRAPASATCEGVQVKIEDLPAYLAHWGLRVVGGDPDLDGEPWRPKVFAVHHPGR